METIQINKQGRGRKISTLQHVLNSIIPGDSVIVVDSKRNLTQSITAMNDRCKGARHATGNAYSYRTISSDANGNKFKITCKG